MKVQRKRKKKRKRISNWDYLNVSRTDVVPSSQQEGLPSVQSATD